MLKSMVYKTKYTALTKQEVIALLTNPKDEMISTSPAVSPKHGDVYLYSYNGRSKAKKGWRKDRIRWVHLGVHSLPKKDPVIVKTYHQKIVFGKRENFFRHGYESTDKKISMVVVQYLGEGNEEEGSCGTMERFPQCSDDGSIPSLPENNQLLSDPGYSCKKEKVQTSNSYMYMGLHKNISQVPHHLKHKKAKPKIGCDNLYTHPTTMLKSVVYKTKYTALTKQEIIALLENPKDEMISTSPAVSPKHGDVYVYSYKERPRAKKGWRADRIRWVHMGVHHLPPKNPVIIKTYHQKILFGKREKFFRHGYESTDKRIGMVVVQYLGVGDGEEDVLESMESFPHCSDNGTVPSLPENDRLVKKESIQTSNFDVYMGLHDHTSQVPHNLNNEDTKTNIGCDNLFGHPPATMIKSIVYKTKYTALTKQEVITLLENPKDEMISTSPAVSPKHGDVYLYSYKGRPEEKKGWRADQIRWMHLGVHSLPKNSPKFVKTYHQKILFGKRENFFRHGYESMDKRISLVVVHYLGGCDEEEGARGIMNRFPQCSDDGAVPSLPEDDQLASDPRYRCRKENAQTSNLHIYMGLHENISQVPHNLKNVKAKRKISRDDLYGVYELSLSLDSFIQNFTLVPEFIIVVSLPEIVNIYNEVCSINRHQLLSYDTTFRLGDFYVSPIIFKCQLFEEEPSIPLAAVIHDNRSVEVHKIFFRTMKNVTVNFNSSDIRLVTDREWTITNALDSAAPNIKHVLRWNHILKDVETWLSNFNYGDDYLTHVHNLLDADSEEHFYRLFECYREGWSKPFLLYFEENIKYDIIHKSGRWLLTELRIYSPDSGVATNVSESTNALLQRLMEFKEISLKQMVFALYFLQTFYLKDVLRGRCGTGNYHLRGDYAHLAMDSANITFNDDYFYLTPDDIIAFLQSKSWNLNRNVDG